MLSKNIFNIFLFGCFLVKAKVTSQIDKMTSLFKEISAYLTFRVKCATTLSKCSGCNLNLAFKYTFTVSKISVPPVRETHRFICLELEAYTACYGIFHANYLKPTCDSGEKMAVVGLTALAKELSTSCPVEIIKADTTPDSCCQYDSIDCSVVYSGSAYRNYYIACNGKNTCSVQVSWVSTTNCSQTVYLPRTNYMKIEYYCIADQGLDPCTSLNTKDSKVFLWNSGYPTTPLSGSSSCTCSIEASCDSNIRLTVIDLRFDTSGECKQSITVTEGTTPTVFDCTNNNDYLPTVLFTSTSHFIRLQIDDNLGTAGGFYFILLEGTAPGAELTLSCSSSAQSNPTITVLDLPECPDDVLSTTPTGISSDPSTSDVYSSTKSTLASDVSTSTIKTSSSSMSPTVASSIQTSLDTLTGSTTISPTGPSFTASSGNTQSTKNTETLSSDSTLPTFVSLGWTSPENDVTGTLMSTDTHVISSGSSDDVTGTLISTDTHVISSASSGYTAGSKISTNLAMGTTTNSSGYTSQTKYGMETTSELSTGYTSLNVETTRETNDPSDKQNNISLIAVIIVLLIVTAGIITFFILYRDKFKEWCCKSKSSSKVDVSEERDDDLLYASIFNINIENRPKPLQLPPMTHQFRASTVSNRFGKDPLHAKTNEGDVSKKKKKKKKKRKETLNEQDTTVTRDQNYNSLSSRKVNAASSETKQYKRKRDKALKKLRKENDLQFKPIGNSHDKSIFPSLFDAPLINSGANRRFRRTSVIDITDSVGNYEKSVEIEFQPVDSSSVV